MATAEFKGVSLQVGQERVLNIKLSPSSVTTEVNVSGGELVPVDVSSARIGANVSTREVAELPLNGRQVSQLYLLAPGAVNNGSGSFDNIRFSGRSNQQNVIRYDGVEGSSIVDSFAGQSERREHLALPAGTESGKRAGVPRGQQQLSGRVRHRHRRPDQLHHQERLQQLSTARPSNTCATTRWTRAISSIAPPRANFA